MELEHLAVQHNVQCRVWSVAENGVEAPFTVVQCTSADATLRRQFLAISGSLLATLGMAPNESEVQKAVASLVELFRALSLPPRKSVQGLWAELFLIARAADAAAAASAWHATPEDRYDFNAGSDRIEVKSSATRARRHHFSLEQLQPPAGARLVVASLFTERSGAGVTLAELVGQVSARLNGSPELQIRLETLVAQTLGHSYSRALGMAFDSLLARDSLAFFDYSTVPRITGELPVGVSDVSFVADLSGSPPLSPDLWVDGLLAAVRPI